MSLQNKTIIITGANSGIGEQTGYLMAKDGANLILTYYENEQEGQAVKAKCLELGAKKVELHHLDLTNHQSIENFSHKINQTDILINNAANIVISNFADTSIEDIEKQIQTNLLGTIKLTKLLLPNIKETIINIGSILGLFAQRKFTTYCVTKFGLRAFTKAIAKELSDRKVYLVAPPGTKTKMGPQDGVDPKKVAELIHNTASGKYNLKTGSEVYYIDYKYGAVFAKIVHLLRKLKNIKKI